MILNNTWNNPLHFKKNTTYELCSEGSGGVSPSQPSVPDAPQPTIDEIKEKIKKGDIEAALEDLKILGATNIKQLDEKDSTGKVIGKTVEFTYSGKEYSITYFSSQDNSDSVIPDDSDIPDDPIGTEEPPTEPGKPLDVITEVMDLNDIPGYADNETKTYNAKSYNKNSYIKKAKEDAKNLLSQYKETFKSYACGLIGNSFTSEYSTFFDKILNSYIENYELTIKTTATGGYTISYKTKDLVDGFLTKLDESIKAKM